MIQNKQVILRTIIKGQDRPSNHGKNNDIINDKQATVNMSYISTQTVIKDFGISNSKMIKVRTLMPLPYFDYLMVGDTAYSIFANQQVSDRRNLTLVEANI